MEVVKLITSALTDEEPQEYKLKEAANIINEVTLTISEIFNEIGADGRLRLAQLLGSDSIRFNQLMKFLPKLGSDLISWGKLRVPVEDPRTETLRDNLLDAMMYVKHFERRFLYFLSHKFLAVNWFKVAAGLALIGGSIAILILTGGVGEGVAIAVDVAFFASAGMGVSLMGNGLRTIRNALYTRESLEHLAPALELLCKAFEIIRDHVSSAIIAVSEEDWEAAIIAGKGIVTHTSSVPSLEPVKGWWDTIFFVSVKLEQIL